MTVQRKPRQINFKPRSVYFKPAGVPLRQLASVYLTMAESEALRLKYLTKLSQIAAAKKMKISQSTFHRTLLSAHTKLANAIVHSQAIKIEL